METITKKRFGDSSFPEIFAGPRRWLLLRLIANGMLQAATALGIAYLLRLASRGDLESAVVAGIACAALLILPLRVVEAGDAERLGQDYVTRVRTRMFARVAAGAGRGGARRRWGVTMTRLISDLNSLRNWVSVGVARATVAAANLVAVTLALLWFDRGVGAVVGAMILGVASSTALLVPRLRALIRESRRRRGRLSNHLGERVIAFRTVQHFGRTDDEVRRVRSHSKRLRDALVRRVRRAHLVRALPAATLPLGIAALMFLARSGRLASEDIAAGVLLLGLVVAALAELARALDYRLAFEEGRRRIGEVLVGPRVREAPGALSLESTGPASLALQGVSLQDTLDSLQLEAAAGEVVALTGPTGSGKSTLLEVIARHFDPDAGTVLVDGLDLSSLRLDVVSRAIQLVSPDVPLLRGRVVDNLSYGWDDLGWAETVAKWCGLLDADVELPRGLETWIEERGHNLAVGTRARIALARAAATRPRILLIDDPMFVLDDDARRALRRIQRELTPTLVIVSPVDVAPLSPDRIWRLDRGRSGATVGGRFEMGRV